MITGLQSIAPSAKEREPAAGAPLSLTECADANMRARRVTSREHFPYIISHFSFFIAKCIRGRTATSVHNDNWKMRNGTWKMIRYPLATLVLI